MSTNSKACSTKSNYIDNESITKESSQTHVHVDLDRWSSFMQVSIKNETMTSGQCDLAILFHFILSHNLSS